MGHTMTYMTLNVVELVVIESVCVTGERASAHAREGARVGKSVMMRHCVMVRHD